MNLVETISIALLLDVTRPDNPPLNQASRDSAAIIAEPQALSLILSALSNPSLRGYWAYSSADSAKTNHILPIPQLTLPITSLTEEIGIASFLPD